MAELSVVMLKSTLDSFAAIAPSLSPCTLGDTKSESSSPADGEVAAKSFLCLMLDFSRADERDWVGIGDIR